MGAHYNQITGFDFGGLNDGFRRKTVHVQPFASYAQRDRLTTDLVKNTSSFFLSCLFINFDREINGVQVGPC